uniref:Uncharacterized protein n=1 Tax=Zea mays TaxID=4577 RepID=A0A804M4I2_MAIZE
MAALPRSPNSARLPLSLRDARWIGESMAAWQGGLSQRFLKVVSYYGLTTLPYKLVCKLVGANLRRFVCCH